MKKSVKATVTFADGKDTIMEFETELDNLKEVEDEIMSLDPEINDVFCAWIFPKNSKAGLEV